MRTRQRTLGVAAAILAWAAAVAHADNAAQMLAALKAGDFGKAKAFMRLKNTNVDAADENGQTALHFAAVLGRKDLVELLIKRGANGAAKDKQGRTPLDLAKAAGHKELLPILEPLARAGDLCKVAAEGNVQAIRKLLGLGVSPNARNADGFTALHVAARNGQRTVAELLLARGADVNAKGPHNTTPLHLAVEANQRGMVALLVAKGADLNVERSSDCRTAVEIAEANANVPMSDFLWKKIFEAKNKRKLKPAAPKKHNLPTQNATIRALGFFVEEAVYEVDADRKVRRNRLPRGKKFLIIVLRPAGELCPLSLSAYRKMKRVKTEKEYLAPRNQFVDYQPKDFTVILKDGSKRRAKMLAFWSGEKRPYSYFQNGYRRALDTPEEAAKYARWFAVTWVVSIDNTWPPFRVFVKEDEVIAVPDRHLDAVQRAPKPKKKKKK